MDGMERGKEAVLEDYIFIREKGVLTYEDHATERRSN